MGTKVWNFLLPGHGPQEIRADNLGQAQPQVYVNSVPQDMAARQLVFSGPGESFIEIKRNEKAGTWNLLVNGIMVEEADGGHRKKGDASLRELRSRPDGSYMIQTDIDVSHVELNFVRKFGFSVHGQNHTVSIAHSEWVWQVVYDGKLVDRVAHQSSENTGEARFDVDVANGEVVKAVINMKWDETKWLWTYSCVINGQNTPVFWTRIGGFVTPMPELPVVYVREEAAPTPTPVEDPEPYQPPQDLPQGVSWDAESRSFQANIRSKTGKFVFLGEFATVQEAHARYLEAIPVHCPDKRVV